MWGLVGLPIEPIDMSYSQYFLEDMGPYSRIE